MVSSLLLVPATYLSLSSFIVVEWWFHCRPESHLPVVSLSSSEFPTGSSFPLQKFKILMVLFVHGAFYWWFHCILISLQHLQLAVHCLLVSFVIVVPFSSSKHPLCKELESCFNCTTSLLFFVYWHSCSSSIYVSWTFL
jgi:hypothetical protein